MQLSAESITHLLIQILVILVSTRICGFILKCFGQPHVVGEMIAGILLGKSVLALLWPEGFGFLFPADSMRALFYLAQIGLICFMFVLGLEMKMSHLKGRISVAAWVSPASIVLPFLFGILIAKFIYEGHGPQTYSAASFGLFMGIAMSITAFPVLARILQERKLTNTPLGTMAITCAAVDDVSGWCLLAGILGIVKSGNVISAVQTFMFSIIYIIIMFKVIKPLIIHVTQKDLLVRTLSWPAHLLVIAVLAASAAITELIGIHALFGAFLAGAIMPSNILDRSKFIQTVASVCTVALLPIFFVYTGIRTQINLINGQELWLICGLIIVLAITGKMLGSALAARYAGMSWRESWSLGALMNTRGLMELVILNIGYDIGILSPQIFSMMTIMAIITTLMTGPLLTIFKN